MSKKKKRKKQGHYCRICGRRKANEKFSGKGHRNHICKACSSRPKSEIDAVEHENEIFNFLNQARISDKNIKRLNTLIKNANKKNSELAEIVLKVARFRPTKKRRLKFLAKEKPDLLIKLIETGLIEAHCDEWIFQVPAWILHKCKGWEPPDDSHYVNDENILDDGGWSDDDWIDDEESYEANDGEWIYDDEWIARNECRLFDIDSQELVVQ